MAKKFDTSLLPDAPDFSFESTLWGDGLQYVAGIDEAGRGALAGPVAAAAVVFPSEGNMAVQVVGVRDSKQMSPRVREDWARRLPEIALTYGIAFASNGEIDELGIVPATRLAMMRALERWNQKPASLELEDWLTTLLRHILDEEIVRQNHEAVGASEESGSAEDDVEDSRRDTRRWRDPARDPRGLALWDHLEDNPRGSRRVA